MEIEKAEVWGQFRFLPHELLETEDVENTYGWVVPDIEPIDAPDAWHPLDLLVALLHDDQRRAARHAGDRRPRERPPPRARAAPACWRSSPTQAGRTVVTTLEREELAEQVRLADTARTIVRNASAQRDLGEVLAECQTGLVEGFRSPRVVDPDLRRGRPRQRRDLLRRTGPQVELPERLVDARRARRPPVLGGPDRPSSSPAATRSRRCSRAERAARDRRLPRLARDRLTAVRAARRRRGVPGQPGADPVRERRVDRARPPGGARHRARPRPGHPQRPHVPARARAGRGAAGARHLQEPADRHRLPRAEEPAHGDHRLPRDPRLGQLARRPTSRSAVEAMGRGAGTALAGGRGPAAAVEGRRPAPAA